MSARDMFELVDYSTDDWGASANYDPDAHGGEREGNEHVVVHHPGYEIREAADGGNIASEKATLRDIEEGAIERNWWGLQYDVAVGQSGSKYAGRGLARSGATSGDVDDDGTHNNLETEAVLVLVRPGTPMTDACRESLTELLDAHGGKVIGHQEAKGNPTACPGEDRMAFIEEYRADDEPGPKPEPAPKPKPKPKPPKGSYTVKVTRETISRERRSTGQLVKIAQGLLLAHGYGGTGRNGSDQPDGKFGWRTHRRTEEFQREHELDDIDGIIGPETWGALELEEGS